MKSLLLFMFIGAACAQVASINDAIGDFSIRLLKKTSCSNGGNSVHSAYSISTALGMCLLGSRGETYANMKDILGLGAVNKSDIQDGFSDSITELTPFAQPEDSPKSFVLSVANRLFVNESFQLSNSYLRRMSNIFHASAVPVDFTNEGPSVQENINAFVSNKTRKLIPKLLDQPLPPTTLMTLVNALYFKGTWEKKFKQRPSAERFNAYENGSNQTAEWVGLTKGFKYAQSETLRAQLVEVPYITRLSSPLRTSMVFILPDESPNLGIAEWLRGDDFSWKNIATAIDSTKREVVDLTFPKFKLESKFSLRKALMDLGMREPFTAKADFSGMVNGTASNLFLDDVLHKAKMDVDEYGTEAAAATAVSVMFMSMPIPNKPAVKLTINRSFIAMIILRHEESIVPLFTAVVDKL